MTATYAVDLHLHSPFAHGVSSRMTLPNLLRWAQLKGLDVLSTGDCLHAAQLEKLERHLHPAEDGLLHPNADLVQASRRDLPARFYREVRFVLGTEVSCNVRSLESWRGVHVLIYLPTFAAVHRLRRSLQRFGDLDGELQGRPVLALSPRDLLALVLEVDGELVPAHIWNSHVSLLNGTDSYDSVHEGFGDLSSRLLACEAALPSTPAHCRRVSYLDKFALLANSDAHSAYKLGRECTLIEGELTYASLFDAIRGHASTARLAGTEEYPVAFSRYWLSSCSHCGHSRDLPAFSPCPGCRRPLARGARDRIAQLADRATPPPTLPFTERLPLYQLIATLSGRLHSTPDDGERSVRLLHDLGPERTVLNELPRETIAAVTFPKLADLIIAQRTGQLDFAALAATLDPVEAATPASGGQLDLF